MINSEQFLQYLRDQGVEFFAGVPDSLLADICACITTTLSPANHIITANEGGAVALASGYHLATGKVPAVYMQNSGLGNAINPLLSLADKHVYSIPMLVIVGHRGEPGVKDEPQHVTQGRIQEKLLDAMEIPFATIGPETTNYQQVLEQLLQTAREESKPVVLAVKKGTFSKYKLPKSDQQPLALAKEEVIENIAHQLPDSALVVSTTGKTSRELFEVRAREQAGHHRDFLTVGSMGHCSMIALGVALQKKDRQVYCFDGDGAVIMHAGSLAIAGLNAPENFKHIVFNNGAHDSVGGQPTVGFEVSIPAMALACGYKEARTIKHHNELDQAVNWLQNTKGPVLLEVWVKTGSREDLGRPTRTTLQNKQDFMKGLMIN
jgi:phosphonopyruvate decarboxylase